MNQALEAIMLYLLIYGVELETTGKGIGTMMGMIRLSLWL